MFKVVSVKWAIKNTSDLWKLFYFHQFFVYGWDFLCEITKGSAFESPLKISHPHNERYAFSYNIVFQEFFDFRAHTQFWNTDLLGP